MEIKAYFEQIQKYHENCLLLDVLIEDNKNLLKMPVFKNDTSSIKRIKTDIEELEQEKRTNQQQSEYIKQFITGLNTRDDIKKVLVLRFIEFRKIQEIADMMFYSKSYIHRLLKYGLNAATEKCGHIQPAKKTAQRCKKNVSNKTTKRIILEVVLEPKKPCK